MKDYFKTIILARGPVDDVIRDVWIHAFATRFLELPASGNGPYGLWWENVEKHTFRDGWVEECKLRANRAAAAFEYALRRHEQKAKGTG